MKKKGFYFMAIVSAAAACACSCFPLSSTIDPNAANIAANTAIDTAEPGVPKSEVMAAEFIEDSGMPGQFRGYFKKAVQGDQEALLWLCNNTEGRDFLGDVMHSGGVPEALEELCYMIGNFYYYYGSEEPLLIPDKGKAYQWYGLASVRGSFNGAMLAGNMAETGDGIPINEQDAFAFYQRGFEIENSSYAYERMAYCYQNGIGTGVDTEKAKEYYFNSMLGGNTEGFYQYLSLEEGMNWEERLSFSKAVSSLDFTIGYFDMVYEGLEGYYTSPSKKKVVEFLNKAWGDGTDPVALGMKSTIPSHEYFPKELIETCVRTSYTYSYHAFAKAYGIMPNRGYEDGKKIKFAKTNQEDSEYFDLYQVTEAYLSGDYCEYYEQDFDGDGENEIGVPLHSGAGGAFMADQFYVFKKNEDGLYEEYAYGPDCILRDAMRIIQYGGRIYFLTNPYSDTEDTLHTMTVDTIDTNGESHSMRIEGNQYQLKQAADYSYDRNVPEHMADFKELIHKQLMEAVEITKNHGMYHPDAAVPVPEIQNAPYAYNWINPDSDVYFTADIDNNGYAKIIRKWHAIAVQKYYYDFNLFQIYGSTEEMLNDMDYLSDLSNGDYYGLHSSGNIYEILPVMGKMVQFWCDEWEDQTYCMALTKNNLVYSLQVYKVENGETKPIYHSVLLDEAQEIKVSFY